MAEMRARNGSLSNLVQSSLIVGQISQFFSRLAGAILRNCSTSLQALKRNLIFTHAAVALPTHGASLRATRSRSPLVRAPPPAGRSLERAGQNILKHWLELRLVAARRTRFLDSISWNNGQTNGGRICGPGISKKLNGAAPIGVIGRGSGASGERAPRPRGACRPCDRRKCMHDSARACIACPN